jgi:hypothetical protein
MTLEGGFTVPLPIAAAFRLFTARGEQQWVEGWEPSFPVAAEDDAEIGTVFETYHSGQHVTWIVVDRDGDRRIVYARVATGRDAGTVAVRLTPAGEHTQVAVAYRLTALTPSGQKWLRDFTAHYPDMMTTWDAAIRTFLGA